MNISTKSPNTNTETMSPIPTTKYTSTNTNTNTYTNTYTNTNRGDKREQSKKKVKNPIDHNIFIECAELVYDAYWKEIFENAAQNKFPRSFSYVGETLIYRTGSHKIKIDVPNIPEEALSVCMSFFKEKGGMCSNDDMIKIKKYNEEISENNKEIKNWTDIKKIKVKELLLYNYVTELSNKYNMDDYNKKLLETTINKGFLLKNFDNKSVQFDDGKITGIKGLIYDEYTNNFIIDNKLKNKTKTNDDKYYDDTQCDTEKKDNKISFMKSWGKFLDYMYKNYGKSSSKIRIINKSTNNDDSEFDSYTEKDTDNDDVDTN